MSKTNQINQEYLKSGQRPQRVKTHEPHQRTFALDEVDLLNNNPGLFSQAATGSDLLSHGPSSLFSRAPSSLLQRTHIDMVRGGTAVVPSGSGQPGVISRAVWLRAAPRGHIHPTNGAQTTDPDRPRPAAVWHGNTAGPIQTLAARGLAQPDASRPNILQRLTYISGGQKIDPATLILDPNDPDAALKLKVIQKLAGMFDQMTVDLTNYPDPWTAILKTDNDLGAVANSLLEAAKAKKAAKVKAAAAQAQAAAAQAQVATEQAEVSKLRRRVTDRDEQLEEARTQIEELKATVEKLKSAQDDLKPVKSTPAEGKKVWRWVKGSIVGITTTLVQTGSGVINAILNTTTMSGWTVVAYWVGSVGTILETLLRAAFEMRRAPLQALLYGLGATLSLGGGVMVQLAGTDVIPTDDDTATNTTATNITATNTTGADDGTGGGGVSGQLTKGLLLGFGGAIALFGEVLKIIAYTRFTNQKEALSKQDLNKIP